MKVLVTGNPTYGIAQAIDRVLSPVHQVDFVSRKHNNIDLNNHSEIINFANNSLNYDVVVNNVRLHGFNQIKLLEQVWQTWTNAKKPGLIINIGSTSDNSRDIGDAIYGSEKSALKKLSETYAYRSVFKKSNIKVTYLSFSWVDTPVLNRVLPNVVKHPSDEIANVIKWVIEYPVASSNLNELRFEVIQ